MKEITIEKLLVWAYREELAKRNFIETLGIGNSLNSGSTLGTHIAGGVPQYYAELIGGGIHDDALKVEQAVNDLGGMRLDLDDPGVLLAEWPDVAPAAAPALAGYRLVIEGLVARMAQLDSEPSWHAEKPEKRVVTDSRSGAPLWFIKRKVKMRAGSERWWESREENGYDPKAKRPLPDAFKKFYFDPSPAAIVDRRYDWLAWAMALRAIADSVDRFLKAFSILGPRKLTLPWSPSTRFDAQLVRSDKSSPESRRVELDQALAERVRKREFADGA